jgi:uncharacterized protein YecT (DUF1311 family)
MDTLIVELWSDLKALTGTQWVMLIALSLLFGFGFFLLLRWVYETRADAQSALIDLKDKTIEHYLTHQLTQVLPKPLSEVLPEDWRPFLEQPYQQLEEVLEDASEQQQMNYTSANMGFIKDAELFILYLQRYHSLPSEEASAFRSEQQAWLRERLVFCDEVLQSNGGSLASLEYSMAFIQRTIARIDELRALGTSAA